MQEDTKEGAAPSPGSELNCAAGLTIFYAAARVDDVAHIESGSSRALRGGATGSAGASPSSRWA